MNKKSVFMVIAEPDCEILRICSTRTKAEKFKDKWLKDNPSVEFNDIHIDEYDVEC